MAFLDKLNDFAKNVGDKAGDAIETSKLNSRINAEKYAIDGVLRKIGEYYYEKYSAGDSLTDEAAALCAEIDGHNTIIAETTVEIERIKGAAPVAPVAPEASEASEAPAAPATPAVGGAVFCTGCGKQNPPETRFCADCGANLNVGERTCTCGAKLAAGVKFCGQCGAKFE